jgi:hypothetical protein
VDVFLVWHVRHAAFLDGRPTEHRDQDGDLIMDDEDDVKLLGVFSSPERAQRRIDVALGEPGFATEPDCFWVDTYTVDEYRWVEGFVSVRNEDQD